MVKPENTKDRQLADDISSDGLRKRGDASGMAIAMDQCRCLGSHR